MIKIYNIKKLFALDVNEINRQKWLKKTLSNIPTGLRVLDAGAGELRNKVHCSHLDYVSQDFCQYEGRGNGIGLQTGEWNTARIDIVSDITNIPQADESFDVIICSEVLEHIPSPHLAVEEFRRLLRPGGKLILTAPFASLVHFAPFHYASGFSRYWYEFHLPNNGFDLIELVPNGNWFTVFRQEIIRWPSMARQCRQKSIPLVWLATILGLIYFALVRPVGETEEISCFGWHCIASKRV